MPDESPAAPTPLQGIRVVEFSHMVMGPMCGMVLGDLGADVIKVEPVGGDATRRLLGTGAGFFRTFNRNKRSLAVDVTRPEGRELILRLVSKADVVTENFKPGRMRQIGLDYATLSRLNPALVYVSLKGFLPGPYAARTALDEVVQMMAGLAYMTGPVGQPLRAGTSVNDIMGGVFGALAAIAALYERKTTGRGQEVQGALFENCVLLAAQHMQQYAVTGVAPDPMPARVSAWGIYDVFTARDGVQIFLAVVSDTQWRIFCDVFGRHDLADDARLATNNDRVLARDWLLPLLREMMQGFDAGYLAAAFERHGLPFAPIVTPQALFDDPHLLASGGLGDLVTENSEHTQVPLLPITLAGQRLPARLPLPAVGENTHEILRDLGYLDAQISRLVTEGVVAGPADEPHTDATSDVGDPANAVMWEDGTRRG
ncbi:CaiB/BaiF CoA transferase family protein [Pandoraea apista]|uniref:CaiB/BaiF CoA transferase family protein n=1 Tax=Pandoraea apista TaxID=93218 RepID=UPI00065E9328|nr:CaiB/BaiF CoA-transferase family protein [Pandoraea apista]ALS63758.1 formyl-CoA transferase [Pandoraea apista]RRW98475.1 CoA transferase [Pandoraea apista]RRX05102.1 CoA transferase [Pandoraea apista]